MTAVRRWCRTCGWGGTYASAARGDYAKRQHSCEKQLARAAAHQRAVDREAAVDRTPKPCHHKIANHQHGTRAAYCLDRCRCLPCARANTDAELHRERQKAYGRYDRYVDAGPVRAHLQTLLDYGIGLKRIAALAGVSNGALTKIVYGAYATTNTGGGCHGPGVFLRGPAKRVTRVTADKLLAVHPIPANLAGAAFDHERTHLCRLQLRALVALGWSQAKLGRRIGVLPRNMTPLMVGDRPMTRAMADRIVGVYDQLSMTLPPQDDHRDRIAFTRSRNLAASRGWVPPLELDAQLEGEQPPADQPTYDEAAVLRRLDGDRTVPITLSDRIEIVRRAVERGWLHADTQRITGVDASVVSRRHLSEVGAA